MSNVTPPDDPERVLAIRPETDDSLPHYAAMVNNHTVPSTREPPERHHALDRTDGAITGLDRASAPPQGPGSP